MILSLLADGKRVGITGPSHKVIANLVEELCRAADKERHHFRGIQKGEEDEVYAHPRIERAKTNERVLEALQNGEAEVTAGTVWLWARPEMAASLDVVVVDEAGQLSLATVCAAAGAAASVVLLGDPNQLPQVSQGTHPEGASASALEHLVGEAKTIPPDRGLLLGTTYRLHPAVNAFVSDAFYEGRLATHSSTSLQRVEDGLPVGGAGIRHVPMATTGASNRSREEAAWVAEAVAALRGRRWVNQKGDDRPLEVDDIIIVAPYNAQVAEIGRAVKERTGVDANVGTVDKFQGREGAIAIYSMTTSTPEDAPRGMDFLYSGNRLNVAVSRARALAVVIASPELFHVACHTPEQMRMLNAFCRLLEVAAIQDPAGIAVMTAAAAGPADAGPPLLLFPELGAPERRRIGGTA
jgi:superfamily I DNA and/or RNA helicase